MNYPLLSPLSRDQTRVTLNHTYPGWHWDGGWPPPTSGCNQLGYFPLQWTHPATVWSISGWHAQTLTVRVSDCTAVTQQWTRRDARPTDLFKTRSLRFVPDGVIGDFHWRNPSGHTVALELTQPLTELSTRDIYWEVKAAGALGW